MNTMHDQGFEGASDICMLVVLPHGGSPPHNLYANGEATSSKIGILKTASIEGVQEYYQSNDQAN